MPLDTNDSNIVNEIFFEKARRYISIKPTKSKPDFPLVKGACHFLMVNASIVLVTRLFGMDDAISVL